jgi:AcrR family transcriptional regulator
MGQARDDYQDILDRHASTDKGRRRVLGVLDCALDIAAREGFEEVTLREVARRLGMSIGNLQHYFATRESLVEAMLSYVVQQYDIAYGELEGMQNASPTERLILVVRYLLADIRNPRTNGIFFELWALANRSDFASDIMTQAYRHHIDHLERLVADLHTDRSATQARAKAVLIAALIEGLMVFLAARREIYFDDSEVVRMAIGQVLAIALDPE